MLTPEQEREARAVFEKQSEWINLDRFETDGLYNGEYKAYEVQVAWQVYLAATERLLGVVAERDEEIARLRAIVEAANKLLRAVQSVASFELDGVCRCEQASYGLPEYSHPGYYCETCQAADIEQELANHIGALDRAALAAGNNPKEQTK